MAFCSNCGKELAAGAKFCFECGTPVGKTDETVRRTVYSGEIHKCPSCGEVLQSMTAICPSCGHEISSAKLSSALKEFIDEINECDKVIANTPKKEMPKKGWKTWKKSTRVLWVILNIITSCIPLVIYLTLPLFKPLLRSNATPELSPMEQRKVALIENFTFPNDRESVLEAMLFVKSKMAFLASEKANEKNAFWLRLWNTKAEQLHQKANILLNNDAIAETAYNNIVASKKTVDKKVRIRAGIGAGIIIVFMDEPENHLHPPLLSALIRALSDLLIDRNGVAVISTHSPIVLQEVPNSCVYSIRRLDQKLLAERLPIKTFGASIGSLTNEVFGLEVTDSGYHKLISDAVKTLNDYEMISDEFDNQLGNEAVMLLRTLLPSCRDCNMDKRAELSYDPENTPVHLYFDDVPDDPWLQVTVGDNLEILYYVLCPDAWDVGIRRRVEKHLDFYKLHQLYSSHANSEIANSIHMWKKTVMQSDPETLRLALMDTCESAEVNDKNSWKSALYRGLVQNFDKVKAYIFQLCVNEQG